MRPAAGRAAPRAVAFVGAPIAGHVVAGSGPLRFGRSVGSPTDGRLLGGAHVEPSPYLRIVPDYAHGDVRWGIEPLVTLIDRAARSVRRQFPDAVTSVGHLSKPGGGDIDHHHSHESGRDADVGFFVRTKGNKPLLSNHFVAFRADGSAASWPGAYFDDMRNWVFVHALITDPQARVTHIFVAAHLRARLLAIAEHLGAPIAVRMRAAELMVQPRGALPHDDHFHVRIACPSHMHGCIENPAASSHAPPALAKKQPPRPRGAVPAPRVTTKPHAQLPHRAPALPPPPKESGESADHDVDVDIEVPGAIVVDDPDGPN
jgi:penicillin-insensitive murein endopeptidase